MKRVIVAGIHHESNTFNPIITGINDFHITRGLDIIKETNTNDSISGIIATLGKEPDIEIIPVLMARAVPNGIVRNDVYTKFKVEILNGIIKAGKIDAIVLSLHGSMRVEELGEAEGDLLKAIRKIQPNVPLSVSLDMHATVTDNMLQYADAMVGYKTAPHIDCFETGVHAAERGLWMLKTGEKPFMTMCRIPMLIAGEQSETNAEPMKSLIQSLILEEQKSEILAASYLMGFPWADCAENEITALIVSSASESFANKRVQILANKFWKKRDSFTFHSETYIPEKALKAACQAAKDFGPVYLSDSGDNPTAGSSSDCTNFLKLIQKDANVKALTNPLVYAGFYDPDAVKFCQNHKNEFITIKLGAKFDTETSSPCEVAGFVISGCESWGSYNADLILLHTDKIDIIITNKHIGFVTPEIFKVLDIDVENTDVIVVKLGYLTAPHRLVAKKSIMALTDGCSNELLTELDYKLLKRPIFPLDKNFIYNSAL